MKLNNICGINTIILIRRYSICLEFNLNIFTRGLPTLFAERWLYIMDYNSSASLRNLLNAIRHLF